jgi:hypothetical protein
VRIALRLLRRWSEFVMKFRFLTVVALFLCSPAFAEQVQFKIVDLLWIEHSTKGVGIEFIYQFERKPSDGDEKIEAFAFSECNRVAPKYVPGALAKAGKPKADFIAITFRFGGAVGTYMKFYADYVNGACKDMK